MPNVSFHTTGPDRDFRRRFRIDGQAGQERLRRALETLDNNAEALDLACAKLRVAPACLAEVKRVLKFLSMGRQ